MENNIIIRETVKDDAPEMLTYLGQIGTETDFLTFRFGEELQLSTAKLEQSIESIYNRKNALNLVAKCDGKIIGNLKFSGGTKTRTAHTGEFGITVLKDYGGKGIGTRLLSKFIEWSRDSKLIRKINLRVRTDNEKAIHLYKKFGFVEEGIIKRDFLINEVFYDSIAMGLLID
ncbi:GNAT family N-acetyltransferase [Sporolactobacillus shoreicorticis]|uniref:GNAT family N-acetyltransferase n=1 Tax=Sporolactobacillus shoreicorticis TaxID=1923877 RepID=A0ABW5S843_9BACL|nr:GNAT family protein [Sporolactobacillus shoreicorticis]MCO7126893.1 GNAT family N-acetyltransferase [Sporolactobacillus shoreicorticis]